MGPLRRAHLFYPDFWFGKIRRLLFLFSCLAFVSSQEIL